MCVCMYVYVCMYMCVCVFIYMCMYIDICISTINLEEEIDRILGIYVCMCVCVFIYIYIYIYVYVYIGQFSLLDVLRNSMEKNSEKNHEKNHDHDGQNIDGVDDKYRGDDGDNIGPISRLDTIRTQKKPPTRRKQALQLILGIYIYIYVRVYIYI
jgi:amino acid transporter